jgi:Predicted metal-binding, possibly nucleic acid-binding protein
LESVGEGVLATGTVEATLEGECSRCLDPIKEELLLDVQELYFYPDKEADEDASRVSAEETIDLDPVVRAAVVLSLPFSPLCRDDCAGLCPDCGANLNDDPDHDHPDRIDPRWSALEGLVGGDDSDRS